jgi:hypothetical protein
MEFARHAIDLGMTDVLRVLQVGSAGAAKCCSTGNSVSASPVFSQVVYNH